jgi:hypothetical protein
VSTTVAPYALSSAARRRDHRQRDAGIARRRLDQRAARLQLSLALGIVHHRARDPVLHAARGVSPFELAEDLEPALFRQLAQPEQGSVTDEVADATDESHVSGSIAQLGLGCQGADRPETRWRALSAAQPLRAFAHWARARAKASRCVQTVGGGALDESEVDACVGVLSSSAAMSAHLTDAIGKLAQLDRQQGSIDHQSPSLATRVSRASR